VLFLEKDILQVNFYVIFLLCISLLVQMETGRNVCLNEDEVLECIWESQSFLFDPCLTQASFYLNNIGDAGAFAIADAIKSNVF